MSDTPRTDNETRDYFLRFDTGGESAAQLFEFRRVDGGVVVDADFARTLERENNQLRATLEEIACVGHIGTGVAPRIAREALSANDGVTGTNPPRVRVP